jgi:hypothetical protein
VLSPAWHISERHLGSPRAPSAAADRVFSGGRHRVVAEQSPFMPHEEKARTTRGWKITLAVNACASCAMAPPGHLSLSPRAWPRHVIFIFNRAFAPRSLLPRYILPSSAFHVAGCCRTGVTLFRSPSRRSCAGRRWLCRHRRPARERLPISRAGDRAGVLARPRSRAGPSPAQ